MRMPWTRKKPFFQVGSMQMTEPVIFDLLLTRTRFGYESRWQVDRMSQSSEGAVALAEELSKVLPEIMRRANRIGPQRPEVIHLKMGLY
jgi:hypothetical protein